LISMAAFRAATTPEKRCRLRPSRMTGKFVTLLIFTVATLDSRQAERHRAVMAR
jgi:hypothetical protein